MIWIGTDDGLIQLTTDDGKTWQNVTPPAITSWSRVTGDRRRRTSIRTRRTRASIAISCQDFEPYIYRTRDMGKTLAEDHERASRRRLRARRQGRSRCGAGCSFAGTERGAFVSFDDGDNWQPLQLNLPVTSVRDFEIYEQRSHRRDARPRLLGDRRHQPAASGRATRSLRADAYLFKPADAIN